MSFTSKIMGYNIKAIIFRNNAAPLVDWAKRLRKSDKFKLMKEKKVLPCPPGRDHIYKIGKQFTIFLASPRKGTYCYLSKPEMQFDTSTNKLNIKYNNQKLASTKDGNDQVWDVSMELMDYDEINFLAEEIALARDKYAEEKSWWDKNSQLLLSLTFVIGVAVALYIIYRQIVFPAADHAIRDTVNVICNCTNPIPSL